MNITVPTMFRSLTLTGLCTIVSLSAASYRKKPYPNSEQVYRADRDRLQPGCRYYAKVTRNEAVETEPFRVPRSPDQQSGPIFSVQNDSDPSTLTTDQAHVSEAPASSGIQSSAISFSNGKLQYVTDSEGNRIPDFGYVGYKYGKVALPIVPVKETISPVSGDNTRNIQKAVDYVGSLPKDENGFRGAVLLNPGTYSTDNPVYVHYDGVVIQGSGSSNTIISSTRTGKDNGVFMLGNNSVDAQWTNKVFGSQVAITDSTVEIGKRSFNVSSASPFKVGDLVVIQHAPTRAWFSAIGNGGTDGDPGWSLLWDDFTIRYVRFITAITGNTITVDAPFYMRLDEAYANLSMYKYHSSNIRGRRYYNIGIENLRIDIVTNGGTDERHTESAIRFMGVIDGWAKSVTTRYFSRAGFVIEGSTRITVEDCFAGPPISQIWGGRRYNFEASTGAQQILFKNCVATDARHGFISNGRVSASGIVCYKGELRNNITDSEGHRHWTTGMLFDSCKVTSIHPIISNNKRGFSIYNRGDWGTSHGWGAVNSVLWNITTLPGVKNVIQKPPTAQNYAIGVDGATGDGPFPQPAGFIELTGKGSSLAIASLYMAQLAEADNTNIDPTTDMYSLTVNSGSGEGSYTAGTVVPIAADAPPSGYVFDQWVVNSGSPVIGDVIKPSTTLTMPACATTVTATYKTVTYTLTVNSGFGGGSYTAGTVVPITANAPPSGYVFDQWVVNSGSPVIGDVSKQSTTLTMPANAAEVTATYKTNNMGQITFKTLDVTYQERQYSGNIWGPVKVGKVDILDSLNTVAIPCSEFGGRMDQEYTATGFFYTKNIDGRWWLIDPLGHPMIHTALNSVKLLPEGASASLSMVRSLGFNGLGAWSDDALRSVSNPMPWTKILYSMYGFAKLYYSAQTDPNNMKFKNNVVPILDSRFEDYCYQEVKKTIQPSWISDPYLIGYFMDNELPWPSDALDRFLTLDPSDVNYINAQTWLQVNGNAINEASRKSFLGYITDKYYSIVSRAIKSVDPNHLFLGSRFHGGVKYTEPVVRSAGKYVDIISINLYGRWKPVTSEMNNWVNWTEKPFLISEFYIKAGNKQNTDGAGWLVTSQQDRGYWYQDFALALLKHPGCVGFQWHRFADPEPGTNGSNKGFLTYEWEPYTDLTSLATTLNQNLYQIVDYFGNATVKK